MAAIIIIFVFFVLSLIFDAITMQIAPMHCRRCYVSVAELNGFIYAMGGYDGNNRQNTAERYDPKTNQWTMIAPMSVQRSDASACTLNGKVYITGILGKKKCSNYAFISIKDIICTKQSFIFFRRI